MSTTDRIVLARRRLTAPLGVAVGALAGLGVVATLSPEETGHYPTCPILAVTGAFCPGCGSLRSLHALAGGDLGTALERNVLFVASLPLALWAWAAWVRRRAIGRAPQIWASAVPLLVAFGVLVLGFAVLRNTSWGSWLAP
ncbi:MAG: DUF2752 domain-containing protein [Sporichthyaceae bacterium]